MKSIKTVILIAFLLGFSAVKGGVDPILSGKRQGSNIGVDSTITVTDDKFTCISSGTCSPVFKTPVLKNAIVLGVDHDNKNCYQSYTFSVTLELTKTPLSNPGTTQKDTIILNLSWDAGAGKVAQDKDVFYTDGYIKIVSKVLNYTSSLAGNAVPANLFIENIIKKERYYALNYAGTTSISSITTGQNDELTVNWTSVNGAEEYDLEWLYLDDFGDFNGSSVSYKSAASIPVSFLNDATRVTVKGTSYTLKNIYQHGYLLFRVRYVGKDTVTYKQRLESRWSSHSFGSTVSSFGTSNVDRYAVTTSHEDTLNWQWTSSFAEEGKSKTVISYFDGSLRSRQMVTYTNTDQLTIVAESFYDHVGRKVVDALPVPTGDSIIKFYRNFNLSAYTQKTYSWRDFDTTATGDSCSNHLTGMDTTSGASRYYSHNNPSKDLYQAYVPDAKQYPFVQVEFMPDNTGRVRKQSGVGYDHRMGSGHETQYFYGKPTQQELDMLFGVEVGDFNRYKKNMVVDPNGSISVSYLNPSGKVIATALAGENPSNLSVLPADTARKRIVEKLDESIPVVDSMDMSISVTHDLMLSTNAQIDFDYRILKNQLELGCTGATICYDCIYDLKFSITDLCGRLLHDTTFIGIKLLDTVCSNDSFMHSFSLALDKGSYRVSKQLSVNKASFDYYEEIYLRNNQCSRTVEELYDSLENEIDYSGCANSCDECLTNLGTLANYKTSRFADLDTNGMNIDSLVTQFESEYEDYVADCKELCDTISTCEIEYYRLLQDVSPGGQYALYSSVNDVFTVTDVLSFLDSTSNNDLPNYEGMQRDWRNDSLVYFDSNGDTALVWHNNTWMKPNDLPDSIFIQNWDPAWAHTLVKMHPEYCYYKWCILNEASNKFDNRLYDASTYFRAEADSLFDPTDAASSTYPTAIDDPFFKTGGLGNAWKTAMQNTIQHYFTDSSTDYSMWQAAAIMASCKDENTVAGISACLTAHPFGSGDADVKNAQWEVFRSLYLSEKQKYKDTVRSSYAYTNSCANCNIGHNNKPLYSKSCNSIYTNDSFKIKQKQYPSFTEVLTVPLDSGTKRDIIQKNRNHSQASIKSECQSQCESYANNWMIALKECSGFVSDSAALRDSLINICKLGCDQFNPLGSRSVAPENEHLVTNKSFKEVLADFFTINKLCNEDLIPFPYEYGHNYSGSNFVPMDNCFKSLVSDALQSSCSLSDEMQALSGMLADLATNGLFTSPTNIDIVTNVGSLAWSGFTTHLMQYTSGHADSLNKYYTYLSGNNLKAVVKSRFNGAWDSCIITFNLPTGHTTGFWDSIQETGVLLANTCGGPLGFTIDISDPLVGFISGSSTCYPVCNDTGTIASRVAAYLNTTYCKNFTTEEAEDYINAYCNDSLAILYIPRDLSCKPACITCDIMNDADADFWFAYSGVYVNSDTVYKDTNFIQTYTNFMNNLLGVNHGYFEYEDLKNNCDSFFNDTTQIYYKYVTYRNVKNGCDSLPSGKLDTLLTKLSLCDDPFVYTPDTVSCDSALRQIAWEQAQDLYQAQLDTLKGNFRKQYFRKCMNIAGLEKFTMAYDVKQYHYTLYYYDQADNLIKTVPPAGVRLITHADTLVLVKSNRANKVAANYYNTPHHNLVTNYKYNTLNAVTEQNTPDGGTTKFYYDRLGRIAVSQNAKQASASNNDFSYTKYDALGRIVEVGETKHTTAITDSTSRNPALLTAWLSSSALFRQVTKTYYDNKAGGTVDAQFAAGQENLRNRVAYITYDEDATGKYDYGSYYTYDIHGNVKELVHDYTELQALAYGYFKLKYEYDLISGNVNKVSYQEGKQDQFFHEYVYDADNRIRQVFTSRDNILTDNDAKYYYYQHGPLARTEIGELKVQGMDYAYTIHGWLKGVNSGSLDSSRDIGRDGWWSATNNRRYIPKDEFGFTLGYYAGDYYDIGQKTTSQHFEINVSGGFNNASPSLYNGNIRHMVTAIGKFMTPSPLKGVMGYAYEYDHLNRIVRMDAYDSINMGTNSWNTGAAAMSQYHNRFTYDANGNILTQVRRGAESVNLALDSLVYKYYPNTNRLSHVEDVVNATNYNDDIDDQDSLNYKYDAIGNLIYDKAEEIDSIQWNVYGKISRIVRTITSTKAAMQFTYGPDGNRLSKKVVYPNDTAPSTGSGQARSHTEYYVRDASGNIMATYTTSNPYFEPIDTGYDKIVGKLIDSVGLASFAQFIQTRFAGNDSFYRRLGGYIPDGAFLDSFTTDEILSCVGDQMFHQLFSCCNSCDNSGTDHILMLLEIANNEENSLVPYLLDCNPELLLGLILKYRGGDLLDNIGNDARILLYGYFRTTAGYLHVNSTVGDTTNFLLSDVPRSELIRFMTHELHTGLYMGYDDYMDALTDVIHTYVYIPSLGGLGALNDDITYDSDVITRCKVFECLGKCPGASSESTCSNWAQPSYMFEAFNNYYCYGYGEADFRNHIKTTPELLSFVHSRLQLCYGDRYAKKLVKTLSDRTTYSTFKNCGMRITEFGYDKYMTDSLISKLVTDNPPQLISVLNQCDSTKLLKAVGNYNIKALVNKINAHIPQGSTFITNTCAYFQLTIPRPVGMTCVNYLAKVVPMDSLLRRIRLNYAFYVDDIGAMPVADLTEVFSRYYSECDFKDCTWPKYADGTLDFDSTHLISTTRDRYWPYLTRELYDCDNDSFTLHAAYTRPYSISELFTKWKYPLDSFMAHVQAYWNSTVRNRIDVDTMKQAQFLTVNEWHLYESSRLGVFQSQGDTVRGVVRSYQHRVSNDTIGGNYYALDTLKYYKFGVDSTYKLHKGLRKYEGTNHLGNVLVVFTDKRLQVCTNDTISYYSADVTKAYDYYPFGAPMRTWNSDTTDNYRFGFNGKEKDNEVSGDGNAYDFGARIYDSRLGRWMSVDPFFNHQRMIDKSPYSMAFNNPIVFIDRDGNIPWQEIFVGIKKAWISSSFGWRIHPKKKKRHLHNGIDLPAPQGTGVRVLAGGTVIKTAYDETSGNYIVVQHGNGYVSKYLHLKDGGIDVEVGQRVFEGQAIGQCGSTGSSTGPHVHLIIEKDGEKIDPASIADLQTKVGWAADYINTTRLATEIMLAKRELNFYYQITVDYDEKIRKVSEKLARTDLSEEERSSAQTQLKQYTEIRDEYLDKAVKADEGVCKKTEELGKLVPTDNKDEID